MDQLESRRFLTFGELEPLFGGGDGVAPAGLPSVGEDHAAIVPMPDGRYYAVTSVLSGSERDLLVRRYTATGTLDTSYAASGSTILPIDGDQFGSSVALDANGSLVLVGTSRNALGSVIDTFVARILPSGAYDTTFNGIGYRTIDFGGLDEGVDLALSGSKIVIGSRANLGTGGSDFGFARLTSTGALDTTFSGDGIAIVDFGGAENIRGVAVQDDGKVVGVGYSSYSGGADIRIIAHRLDANGTSDGGFGTGGGWREFNLPNSYEVAEDVAVSGNRIYIAGSYLHSALNDYRGIVIAMNASTGTTDSTFNTVAIPTATNGNGLLSVLISPGENTYLDRVAVDTDRRILVGGSVASTPGNYRFALAAITPDGSFDPTLDGDGRLVSAAKGNNPVRTLAITADHSVLMLEEENVLRLRGMLDLSYGVGGTSSIDLGGNRFVVVATHVLSDGKTLAALSSRGGDLAFYVARFNVDGSLDTGFGNANPIAPGLARIAGTGGLLGEVDTLNTVDMLVEPDGQIVVAGTFARFNSSLVTVLQQVAVGRFNSNGSIDSGFGTNGLALVEGDFSNEIITSVALAPDNDILVGGYQGSPLADIRPLIVRLTDVGARDLSFDADGVLSPLFNSLSITRYNTRLMDLAVRPNGNIVYVGGWQSAPTGTATANGMVVELLPTGAPNPAFGLGGFGDAGTGSADRLHAVALQPDGKLVAAGHFAQIATVIRVNANGFYDASFGVGGIATGPAVGNGLLDLVGGVDLLIQPDGRILASAVTTEEIPGLPGESALWRLDSAGVIDSTFQPFDGIGEFGKPFNLMIYAIGLQADGKVIVGGSGNDIVLRRTTAGRFQAVSARYMINGYNGPATYPTWRVRFSEPVDLSSVATSDFNVLYKPTAAAAPTVVPAGQLAWQSIGDPYEVELYYTGPGGPASFVWPKGYFIVSVVGGSILSTAGAAVAGTPVDFSTFRVLPGDFDNNGTVNFNDLLILAQNYNGVGKLNAQGDATYDGIVNFNDLLILAQNYNQSLSLATTRPAVTARKNRPALDVLR
jgi:uncharacterized delta-60 repeat protein